MHDEGEKKRKGLRLVSKKSTRRMLGKWRKLNSDENDSITTKEVENNENIDNNDLDEVENPRKVLGLKLIDAIKIDPSLDGVALPSFFRYAIDFIEEQGLTTEGIYRLSPPKSRLDELEKKANSGEPLVFVDAHDAAGLIKRFLRQVPEPLLPSIFENIVESCTCGLPTSSQLTSELICSCGAAIEMRKALDSLDKERKTLFSYVFLHAQHVMINEKENKMGLQALGLLLQTILEMSRKLVSFCAHMIRPFNGVTVQKANYLIDETVKIEKYVPPKTSEEIEKWLDNDDLEVEKVGKELSKQLFLLDLLHSKISARHKKGLLTSQLDENAWQIQKNITAIKRKLKQISEPIAPVVSVAQIDGRCIEIYEEKQLMATQGMLKEDITYEQKKIAILCWKIEKHLTENEKEEMENDDNNEWKERCNLEEAARNVLINEITSLRLACSGLRALLEFESFNK